ncbi:hypothetical protein RRF55_28640, partial [Klebsiella sp. K47]|uniref:hypothetical protein n=1 Tax=Klebsiella sp. K47 TaxID=3077736 RepID=UPI003F44ED16
SYEFTAYMPKTGKMQRQLQHRAALAFTYDGQRTSDKSSSEVIRIDGNVRQRIHRQPDAEKALRQTLKKMRFSVA